MSFDDAVVQGRKDRVVLLRCKGKDTAIYRVDSSNGNLVKQSTRKNFRAIAIYRKAQAADAGYYLCKNDRNTAVATYNFVGKSKWISLYNFPNPIAFAFSTI